MKTRILAASILAIAALTPGAASAQLDDDTQKAQNSLGGFGGALIYSNTLGRGTFTTGEASTSLYNMAFSIRPSYLIDEDMGLKVRMRLDFSVNIVENVQSTNTRPNQVQFADMRLQLTASKLVEIPEAYLSWDGALQLYLPTSRASQIQNKILGLNVTLGTNFKPVDWFTLQYDFGVTKNFNRYTNEALDTANFSTPLPTRAGGSEAVVEGVLLLGGRNTEWTLTHTATASFAYAGVGLDVQFVYQQGYAYDGIPVDELSSPHAATGRGMSDLMRGLIEINYTFNDYVALGLGTYTDQTPLTADNENFRFPWWDTTNGAANRQVFYLDVIGTF